MDINQKITEELGVKEWQVEAAVKLIDEGNTIPFISRYRKEATGSLNDEQLRKLYERLIYLRNLEEKKEQVIATIEEQGKLTEELKLQILAAETLVVVEDLYRPYRPKRRTRATIAKEKGLEPLAALITLQKTKVPIEEAAKSYISEEKEVKTAGEAINGAKDIIAEYISDEADYRIYIRDLTAKQGKITSIAKDAQTESVYEMYYEFEEPITKLAGHRILALNRGEKEKILTVKVEAPEERILQYLEKKVISSDNVYTTPILQEVIEDRKKLESIMGYPVRGLAYPNGSESPEIRAMLPALGIRYGRVVGNTDGFAMPEDFLQWKATCHHNHNLLELGQQFVDLHKKQYLYMMYVWGHSYEFTNNNNWEVMEDFCKLVGGKDDIWYATNIQIVDYMDVVKAAQYAADGSFVYNPCAQSLWLCVDDEKFVEVKGGQQVQL